MVVPGDTLTVLVVAVVLHEYVVAPLAVKVVDRPAQIVALFTATVGIVLTVTVAVFVVIQPNVVPVTV